MAVYFERTYDLQRHIPIPDAGTVNHYYAFIIIKMLIWTFFKKEKEKIIKRAKQRAVSEGQLLLALAWRKRLSQWDYVPSHNLSVV